MLWLIGFLTPEEKMTDQGKMNFPFLVLAAKLQNHVLCCYGDWAGSFCVVETTESGVVTIPDSTAWLRAGASPSPSVATGITATLPGRLILFPPNASLIDVPTLSSCAEQQRSRRGWYRFPLFGNQTVICHHGSSVQSAY